MSRRMDDLGTSLTIDHIRQSDIGKILDAIRDAGFLIEVNVTRDTEEEVIHVTPNPDPRPEGPPPEGDTPDDD